MLYFLFRKRGRIRSKLCSDLSDVLTKIKSRCRGKRMRNESVVSIGTQSRRERGKRKSASETTNLAQLKKTARHRGRTILSLNLRELTIFSSLDVLLNFGTKRILPVRVFVCEILREREREREREKVPSLEKLSSIRRRILDSFHSSVFLFFSRRSFPHYSNRE